MNNFFYMYMKAGHAEWAVPLAAFLLSSPGHLERERVGRPLGLGGLKLDGWDWHQVLVPDPASLDCRLRARLGHLVRHGLRRSFSSLLADNLSDDTWRRELDQAVLGWMGVADIVSVTEVQAAMQEVMRRRIDQGKHVARE